MGQNLQKKLNTKITINVCGVFSTFIELLINKFILLRNSFPIFIFSELKIKNNKTNEIITKIIIKFITLEIFISVVLLKK